MDNLLFLVSDIASCKFYPRKKNVTQFPLTYPEDTEMAENDVEQELLDYDEEDTAAEQTANGAETVDAKKAVKGNYVSIHASGFRDFLLKPELLRAIVDCGFEHPSEGNAPNA